MTEITNLLNAFAQNNIKCKSTSPKSWAPYQFSTDLCEADFLNLLLKIMDNLGWESQGDDLFPGKPDGDDSEGYYIEKDEYLVLINYKLKLIFM